MDIVDQIKEQARISEVLQLTRERRQALDKTIMDYADEFLSNIRKLKAYNSPEDIGEEDYFNVAQGTLTGEEIIGVLKKTVDHEGINPASGGHLGYIPGGGIYPSALGDYLAAVMNRYAGIYFGGPAAVRLENALIRWTADLMGYPENALGNLASGGSVANLIAITTARDAQQINSLNIRESVIYLTKHTHHCVHKAIRIAGLGECIVREVVLDNDYRLDAHALELMLEEDRGKGLNPFLVISSVGSTDTGAVDPIDRISDLADQYHFWHHIDAAYGGYFILVDRLKDKFRGVEKSDSIVIDPHKTLFLPYGVGMVLVKHGQSLIDAHYYRANYMQDAFNANEQTSPADVSPELTKHFRGLRMWIPLKLLGIEPFAAALKEKHLLTVYFHKRIKSMGFEVGPQPELSVCIYRYAKTATPNKFNALLLERVQDDGRIFISSTTINGVYWLRAAIVCFRTRLSTVDLLLQILQENTQKLLKELIKSG